MQIQKVFQKEQTDEKRHANSLSGKKQKVFSHTAPAKKDEFPSQIPKLLAILMAELTSMGHTRLTCTLSLVPTTSSK